MTQDIMAVLAYLLCACGSTQWTASTAASL